MDSTGKLGVPDCLTIDGLVDVANALATGVIGDSCRTSPVWFVIMKRGAPGRVFPSSACLGWRWKAYHLYSGSNGTACLACPSRKAGGQLRCLERKRNRGALWLPGR